MGSSMTNKPFRSKDQVHTTYTFCFPFHIVSATIATSLRFMQSVKTVLDTSFEYIILLRSALHLDWHRHACLNCKISSVEKSNKTFLKTLLTVIIRISFKWAVYKTIVFVAKFFQFESNQLHQICELSLQLCIILIAEWKLVWTFYRFSKVLQMRLQLKKLEPIGNSYCCPTIDTWALEAEEM